MNQDYLFASFLLDPAEDIAANGIVRPGHDANVLAGALMPAFRQFATGLGAPYADRAESAEVALEAVAAAIFGAGWDHWVTQPSHRIGKQGYRAEALILIMAMTAVGADAGRVRDWYGEREGIWDDSAYSRSGCVPEAVRLIEDLRVLAAGRPDGDLYALAD